MEIILTDAERRMIDYMTDVDVDVGIGDNEKNDFELTMSRQYMKEKGVGYGSCFYVPNTEFGGIIEDIEVDTSEEDVTLRGYTWRGFLEQLIIEPPEGQGYLIVSGDANTVIRELLQRGTGTLFEVPEEESGIKIKKQSIRYADALTTIGDMLEAESARIDIRAVDGEPNEPFKVIIKAVPVKCYEEELEYNGDDGISVEVRDYRCGVNHLICLGQGELEEREVVHLYVQLDGSISQKQYYTGSAERIAVYDYSSAKDTEELVKGGTERLESLANYKKAEMTVEDVDLDVGDVVAARDREAGIVLSRPIISKIFRYSDKKETIEYKVKGES